MNTVRSCLVASALALLFAVAGYSLSDFPTNATDVRVCCSSPGGDDDDDHPICQYGNRTFRTVEIIGGGPCPEPNSTDADDLQPVRKCCPSDHAYDPGTRSCRPAEHVDTELRGLITELLSSDRIPGTVVGVGYEHGLSQTCPDGHVLVDELVAAGRPLAGHRLLSPNGHNCFDVTPPPARKLVNRMCQPLVQHCGKGNGRYTCVNKCCRGNKIINAENKCRLSSNRTLDIAVYETTDSGSDPTNRTILLQYYSRLNCNRDIHEDGSFKLLADGTLYLPNNGRQVPDDKFCLEYHSTEDGNSTALTGYTCIVQEEITPADMKASFKYLLLLLGFVPSIVCLSVTLIVYAMLSNLRNVHGYYVMCYVACLLLSIVCLLFVQWMTDDISRALCKFFGYAILFLFLTTFCWLNVICFDIYWILRYNNPIEKSSSISVRTIIYNIYCWGFSSVCTCTAFFFQHSNYPVLSKFAPDLGTESCWFSKTNYLSSVVFFVLPVSIMLLANLILFVLTAVHCSRIKSELNKFKRTDSKTRRFKLEQEKFVVGVKLFLVMGIPWSFEMLSKIFNNDWIIWYILDEINALQGVMVFVIFVAKRKIIANLRKKFNGSLDHSFRSTFYKPEETAKYVSTTADEGHRQYSSELPRKKKKVVFSD